jgi:hypothetical protein
MKKQLWKELTDHQAQILSGGEGIGQPLSDSIHYAKDKATSQYYGYNNANQLWRERFPWMYDNVGDYVTSHVDDLKG